VTAERAVIYVRGDDDRLLRDAERECDEYAERFGWSVQESIYAPSSDTGLSALMSVILELDIGIVLTGSLDMISPDQETRDMPMMQIEKTGVIVHPVSTLTMLSAIPGCTAWMTSVRLRPKC